MLVVAVARIPEYPHRSARARAVERVAGPRPLFRIAIVAEGSEHGGELRVEIEDDLAALYRDADAHSVVAGGFRY